MVTPGRLLNALKVTSLDNTTLSKIVPNAVTRSLLVEMVHSKLELCRRKVAKSVKLSRGSSNRDPRLFDSDARRLVGDDKHARRLVIRNTDVSGSTDCRQK